MKVSKLIEELQKLDPDARVLVKYDDLILVTSLSVKPATNISNGKFVRCDKNNKEAIKAISIA